LEDYRGLAAFRYHIRQYLDFSNGAARSAGLEPKQYELLLAIKGKPDGVTATVGVIADHLYLRNHSAVELINRAAEHGFLTRTRISTPRTHVLVGLTKKGERMLSKAVALRLKEIRRAGPALAKILASLNDGQRNSGKAR
jgi:DNA-binding MarR family transcriptional regulator